VNPYAKHAARIEILCRWISEARTTQAAVGRYESAIVSADPTPGELRRLRIARRLAISNIAHRTIRVAGSRED
jgi:hypothetical protein